MKRILVLTAGVLLMGVNLYAGNGDMTVNGNLGVGASTTPTNKLAITTSSTYNSGISLNGKAALSSATDDNWLRLNNDIAFIRGVYTPGILTAGSGYSTNWAVLPPVGGAYFAGNVGIGQTNPGSYKLYVNGITYSSGGYQPSDSKFKKDIKQIDNAVDKVKNISGYSYLYKIDEYKEKGFPEGTQLGVIAEEVETVVPEAVITDEDGSKAVNYSSIIPVLIEAVKAQQKTIEQLQTTVTQLENQLKSK